jgi:DHA1 family inner membrane transport protein
VDRGGVWEGVLLAGITTVGFLYLNLMPAMIHALTQGLDLSKQAAGLIASANGYGTAIGNFVGIFIVARVPWRAYAGSLLVALIAVDAASMLTHAVAVLASIRFVHGLCGGALIALGFALIGRTRNPDRNFGLLLMIQCGLAGAGVLMLPRFAAEYGSSPFFAALIAFDALMLAMLPVLDPSAENVGTDRSAAPAHQFEATGSLKLTLAGIFLFQTAKLMVGAHIIDLGRSKGLSLEEVTLTVGLADWSAILGASLVVFLSTRIGRALPLSIGIAAAIVCAGVFRYSSHLGEFRSACVLSAIVGALVLSYLFAISARIAGSGRHAALAGFASKLGLGTAPILGAFIVAQLGYSVLLVAMASLFLICAACVLPTAIALDQRDAPSSTSATS